MILQTLYFLQYYCQYEAQIVHSQQYSAITTSVDHAFVCNTVFQVSATKFTGDASCCCLVAAEQPCTERAISSWTMWEVTGGRHPHPKHPVITDNIHLKTTQPQDTAAGQEVELLLQMVDSVPHHLWRTLVISQARNALHSWEAKQRAGGWSPPDLEWRLCSGTLHTKQSPG